MERATNSSRRKELKQGKVALISGGRFGPRAAAHGGLVGHGMLDAACPGHGLHLADSGPDAGRR
ncbi:hypothetical protein ACVOMV_09825 [Mesorhizobium atlanticum]